MTVTPKEHEAGAFRGSDRSAGNERRWYALVVRTRHEKVAGHALADKGFDTFLPLFVQRHQYGGRRREFNLPLFPGYLFCRFQPEMIVPVLNTQSVIQVVGVGRKLVSIDEAEVESLRIATEAAVAFSPHPYLAVGRKVRVVSGPMTGAEGVVLELKNSFQLVMSVTMLQRSVAVQLDRTQIVVE
jgi:transcription antitermination factor NusG